MDCITPTKHVLCLTMTPPAIPHDVPDASLALFLDVDGTLLDIAATPDAVVVSESLRTLLGELAQRLDGALALVSGRSIATLDTLFAPLHLAAAGIHGSERRDANGSIFRPDVDAARLTAARESLRSWSRQHAGTLLEDKGSALALHYRLAPEREAAALEAAERALDQLAGSHELQRGKFVFEIRPAGLSKGSAIAAFMERAPFQGRMPIFIGDDVTDEAGFAVVNAFGGLSIRVGPPAPTSATHRLADVEAVLVWLQSLANRESSLTPARSRRERE